MQGSKKLRDRHSRKQLIEQQSKDTILEGNGEFLRGAIRGIAATVLFLFLTAVFVAWTGSLSISVELMSGFGTIASGFAIIIIGWLASSVLIFRPLVEVDG